ncbi:sigma-54 dependent transcriptional regulator [Salinispirillum sp. LH 10-3-1]|uniref:Sigma-54 dependent transcriptional regulator n=1 Tax=Salinispirillum sp. LH 10-3-1 TaxID=2952525 RepID=A0AB38YDF3_9GAMM
MNKPALPILLVEDDEALARLISDELDTEGWLLTVCHTLQAANEWLASHRPSLVITDLRLPDGNGMELVNALTADERADRPSIIVITAFGSVRQAVRALQAGANDFLTKPLDIDHFMLCVQRVLQHRSLHDELNRYRALSQDAGFHGLFGQSPAMRQLYEQIRVIGRAQGPVLINGESGTGKELVARALVAESDRADKPFLAVNCAGIPQELLESEFFGHAAGAFTGARKARKGLLQEANGGTLLLDEIGEMPLSLQAKLLRALQDGSIRPVGQDTEEQVDVRIIAATHRDLRQQAESGAFREDLYYRLETFALHVPALRDRGDDRELLAQRFLNQLTIAQNKPQHGFSLAARQLINDYPFPGNVRELQNAVERALAFCRDQEITPEHLPSRMLQTATLASTETVRHGPNRDASSLLQGPVLPTLDELQQRYVHMVLDEVQGNKRRAAALLGIGRRTLYRWLEASDTADE